MKKLFAFLLILVTLSINAQERKIPQLPNIPGYQTLACDFHLHTVFSDGLVWPTVRVDEAWYEGIDAIAITDHLEYLPHKKDINTDYNRSWEIAKKYARGKDVIVIPGTEITKGMPPGHINAIFVKDADSIYNEDYKLAIEEAARQGAFIMWNHPGWKRQQPDTMLWWNEHTELLEKGWLHGIEVANHNETYPLAVDWAEDKGLTIFGNSDMHQPFISREFTPEQHRFCTFVFATERSEGGIRDALFNGRTIAYAGKDLMGKKELLEILAKEMIDVQRFSEEKEIYVLKNPTGLELHLKIYDKIFMDWKKDLILKPWHESLVILPGETKSENLSVSIENMICGYKECLEIDFNSL